MEGECAPEGGYSFSQSLSLPSLESDPLSLPLCPPPPSDWPLLLWAGEALPLALPPSSSASSSSLPLLLLLRAPPSSSSSLSSSLPKISSSSRACRSSPLSLPLAFLSSSSSSSSSLLLRRSSSSSWSEPLSEFSLSLPFSFSSPVLEKGGN